MAKAKQVKRKAGRPKVDIDWERVGKMLEAGCFATGIAATMGIDESTLRKRCEDDNNLSFSEYSQQKKAKGDELLRAKQFGTAMAGNVTMQIWLGKQRLGQVDKSDITQTIKQVKVEWLDGEPIDDSYSRSDTVH